MNLLRSERASIFAILLHEKMDNERGGFVNEQHKSTLGHSLAIANVRSIVDSTL